jgi:hypothetical protein
LKSFVNCQLSFTCIENYEKVLNDFCYRKTDFIYEHFQLEQVMDFFLLDLICHWSRMSIINYNISNIFHTIHQSFKQKLFFIFKTIWVFWCKTYQTTCRINFQTSDELFFLNDSGRYLLGIIWIHQNPQMIWKYISIIQYNYPFFSGFLFDFGEKSDVFQSSIVEISAICWSTLM